MVINSTVPLNYPSLLLITKYSLSKSNNYFSSVWNKFSGICGPYTAVWAWQSRSCFLLLKRRVANLPFSSCITRAKRLISAVRRTYCIFHKHIILMYSMQRMTVVLPVLALLVTWLQNRRHFLILTVFSCTQPCLFVFFKTDWGSSSSVGYMLNVFVSFYCGN